MNVLAEHLKRIYITSVSEIFGGHMKITALNLYIVSEFVSV
jgi:hypothetical protein